MENAIDLHLQQEHNKHSPHHMFQFPSPYFELPYILTLYYPLFILTATLNVCYLPYVFVIYLYFFISITHNFTVTYTPTSNLDTSFTVTWYSYSAFYFNVDSNFILFLIFIPNLPSFFL